MKGKGRGKPALDRDVALTAGRAFYDRFEYPALTDHRKTLADQFQDDEVRRFAEEIIRRGSSAKQEGARGGPYIYVDNLEASIDNEALHDTFILFGTILSCKVACDGEGRSKGSGIVHFGSAASAKQASERVHDMQIGEKTAVVVQLSIAEARFITLFLYRRVTCGKDGSLCPFRVNLISQMNRLRPLGRQILKEFWGVPWEYQEIRIKFLSGEVTEESFPCDMSIRQLKKELAQGVAKKRSWNPVDAEERIRIVHAGRVLEEDIQIGSLNPMAGATKPTLFVVMKSAGLCAEQCQERQRRAGSLWAKIHDWNL